MQRKPSALTAVIAILGYLVVVFTVWAATGLKYDNVGDTVANVQKGITLAIGLGSLYLIIATSVLGWWTPAIRVPRKVGSTWMLVIPALLLVGAILNISATKWTALEKTVSVGKYAFWLGLGCVFVGFSEELLTRGLAIVGGRGSFHENRVWIFSGVIFGLLHAPNAAFGQSVSATLQQVVYAFVVAIAYYVTRRVTGTLVTTMVLHALWDFGVFIQGQSVDGLKDKPKAFGGFLLYIAIIVSIIALRKILKEGDVVEPGGDQLAAFTAG